MPGERLIDGRPSAGGIPPMPAGGMPIPVGVDNWGVEAPAVRGRVWAGHEGALYE